MRLLSAEEDFRRNTLDRIIGVVGKAYYFANLKAPGGSLHHWGLERQYGPQKAAEILEENCTQQLQTLLQEEMASLWQEVQTFSRENGTDSKILLKKLVSDLGEIAPNRLTKLQLRHLKVVLDALSEIAEFQNSKQDSSQGRLPGQ